MRCCIGECKSNFKNGIRSHCIPTLPVIRKLWLDAVKIINPGPNDRICSKHFTRSDYQEENADSSRSPPLLSGAIPSQNLPIYETNRGFDNILNIPTRTHVPLQKEENDGYQLQFDDDIGDDERRFYLKLFPLVNLVREKRTHCTSCNVHLGTAPANEENVKMHPILRVSQCKKCHDFYNSGEFSKGEDGSELYCRWCGQGGEVYCCAKCPYVFCKACIGGNLAKSLVADIRDNENWSCFVCSPKITWPIRAVHWALKNYIGKQKQSILLANNNETEIRRLLKKDTSYCCRGKLPADEDTSNIGDSISVKKTYTTAASILKKRKRSNEEILGQPKPKILNSILTGSNNINNPSGSNTTATLKKANPMSGYTIASKNQMVMLNSGLVIQKHPSSSSSTTSNSGTAIIRPIQHNQTQVKVVQLTNQHNKAVPIPGAQQHAILQTVPPPLVIRNRGVQIRQHAASIQNRLIPVQRSTTTTSSSSATTTTTSGNGNGTITQEHTPVYHTIGGFCIDLNSAAQHDSIRLPNGKLIQVKKSSNTTNNTTSTIGQQRNQIPSGILHQQPSQPQQHFTITQPLNQQQNVNNVSGGNNNIQTIAASAIIPNANGSLQILNGNVIQQIQGQPNQTIVRQSSTGPILVRNIFPNTAVGKARDQLQNQIFTAMEICQHLSGKIQTLTNSNPYKNASNHIDVKELYIHLSYLFTYAIGRFKNLQDKCNEDMTSMGFNTDVSKLTKGQLAAEKYASDGDEDEIEIVEPKTTTIDLDSDDDESTQSIIKSSTNIGINPITLKELQRQQVAKQNQMLRDKQNQQNSFKQLHEQQMDDNDYDLPLTLLAGMLEVELTEGNDSLNSTASSGSTLPKKPRKKTTNKPNPHLIKQQQEQLRAKYDEIKRCDLKLKQECSILIGSLDLDIDDVKEAFQRYSEQQNDDDDDNDINNYDMMSLNNNNENNLNNSGNLDDSDVGVMQLLEVTMDGDGGNGADDDNELLNNSKNTNKKLNENTILDNEKQIVENVDKENGENQTKKMEIDEIADTSKNNSEKIDIEEEDSMASKKDTENIEENPNNMEIIGDIQEEELKNVEKNEMENKIKTKSDNKIETELETENENNEHKINAEDVVVKEDYFENEATNEVENCENILDNEMDREKNNVKVKETEKKSENDELNTNNVEKPECLNERNRPELNQETDTTPNDSEKLKFEDDIKKNDEDNDSNDNSNSINKEIHKSIDEEKETTENSVIHTDNIDKKTNENNLPDDNCNKSCADINLIHTESSELKSNIETESNVNKITDIASTIEPMEVDTNLLNLQNSSELIDELLADTVKTKSSSDDCPNDFIDDHQLSLLTSE